MKPIVYHRQWPSLLKEGLQEGLSDPAQYTWDNVDDDRAIPAGRDTYVHAIRTWLATRSETIYTQILAKVDAANPELAQPTLEAVS